MLGLQGRGLVPVIGRHGHAPNVPWFIQFDPAVQRVLRIDIDNPIDWPDHLALPHRREARRRRHGRGLQG
jgi:hypothetical protein